jgi:peptidoglycan/xylan/chitin deacetylase (PgdA/CDA1 family)
MLGWFSPYVFLGQAQRRLLERGMPVFAYHRIAQPPSATTDPFLYVSPSRFEDQLARLRHAALSPGSLSQALGPEPGTDRKAVITFDDGFVSVLEHGMEILARHNFRAIQFLVARFLGGKNEWDAPKGDVAEPLMDEAQVRDWLAAGHEIGSHSMTHPNLRLLSPADAREEIVASKKLLEDRFGVQVRDFCYPYGAWNDSVRDAVAEAGYRTACTVEFGVNDARTPRFELRRIVPLSSAELLRKIIHRLRRSTQSPASSPPPHRGR